MVIHACQHRVEQFVEGREKVVVLDILGEANPASFQCFFAGGQVREKVFVQNILGEAREHVIHLVVGVGGQEGDFSSSCCFTLPTES